MDFTDFINKAGLTKNEKSILFNKGFNPFKSRNKELRDLTLLYIDLKLLTSGNANSLERIKNNWEKMQLLKGSRYIKKCGHSDPISDRICELYQYFKYTPEDTLEKLNEEELSSLQEEIYSILNTYEKYPIHKQVYNLRNIYKLKFIVNIIREYLNIFKVKEVVSNFTKLGILADQIDSNIEVKKEPAVLLLMYILKGDDKELEEFKTKLLTIEEIKKIIQIINKLKNSEDEDTECDDECKRRFQEVQTMLSEKLNHSDK